jgi:hypothetical protein
MVKKILFYFVFLLTLKMNAQTLTSSLNGTFVSGIVGVNNTITVIDLFGDEAEVEFFLTNDDGSVVIDSYIDNNPNNGFSWDIDMGDFVPNLKVWAVFYDEAGDELGDTFDSALQFNVIEKPYWLFEGSVSDVVVNSNSGTISFLGNYPIYSFQQTISPSILGIGGRPLGIVGSFFFRVSYSFVDFQSPNITEANSRINLNLLNQKNYNQNISYDPNDCSIGGDFNLILNIERQFNSAEISLKTPKFKFPLGPTGVSISLDAGISLYATLTGQVVVGEQDGEFGFIEDGEEATRIVGLLNGKAYVRGELSALAGVVKVSGTIRGDARLGIGFEYMDTPEISYNSVFGGDLKLYGEACYKTFWGVGPSKCISSSNWYYGAFGDVSIFNKSNENDLLNFRTVTFRDTGRLALPDFHPQPSFGTKGNNLYVSWLEHEENLGYLLFSKLNSATNEFTDVKIVTSNTYSISNPKIALFPSGSAIITWSQNRYNDDNIPADFDEFDLIKSQDIWFAIYDINLDSIIYIERIEDDESGMQSGRAEGEAAVTIGENGDALLTWVVTSSNSDQSQIYYTHIVESIDGWEMTEPEPITILTGLNYNTNVVFTDENHALAVWINDIDADEDTYNSNLLYSVWDGNNWSTADVLVLNDGFTKLNELSIASNDGFVAFAWTSLLFDEDNLFENRIDMIIYDAVIQDWDLESLFTDRDSNYYFLKPITSISDLGFATICYQVIDMYADSTYIPNGELYLYAKNLYVSGEWEEIAENTFLCDTSTFIWELTSGFSVNNNYYVITQEYNDDGIVDSPLNGVKFGDPSLSMVLRGIKINDDLSVSDIEEPGNVSSGIKELNSRMLFKLNNIYPNPSHDITTIEYQLEKSGFVSLEIIDFFGNKIADLVNENLSQGIYKTLFTPSNIAGGVYYCRLTVNGKSLIKKIVFVK